MRSIALALLLPLAACASAPPATQTAALDAAGPAGPAVEETEAKTKEVCWTEIVSGTRSRKQKVCRTERSERNGEQTRDALRDFQDRSGTAGPPPIMGGG